MEKLYTVSKNKTGADCGSDPAAHRAHPRHPRPAAQPSARRMDGASGGLGSGDNAPTTEALFVALGAGVTALSHPLLYVKLLIQVWGPGGSYTPTHTQITYSHTQAYTHSHTCIHTKCSYTPTHPRSPHGSASAM